MKYFAILFLFGAMVAGTITAASWPGNDWKVQAFLDSGDMKVTGDSSGFSGVVTRSGGAKCIFSIGQKMSAFDPNGRLVARFQARKASADGNYLLLCVSSSPGANLPCARFAVPVTTEWQDCEVPIPLTGLAAGSVFEFIWEGMLKTGDRIEVRNLNVVEEHPQEGVQLLLQEPATRNLIDGVTPMRLSGVLRPLRDLEGGSWQLQLTDAATPDQVLRRASGTLAWPETAWSLDDVAGLPDGNYRLTVTYSDRAGQAGTPVTAEIRKLAAATACSYVKDNTLYYDGKPFLPIGMFHTGVWNLTRANAVTAELGHQPPSLDAMYADMAAHGFNTLLAVSGVRGQEVNEWADYARRHGMLVVPQILKPEDPAFTMPANLLGWYGADEATGGESGAQARTLYAGLKYLAPVSTVFSANYEPHMLTEMRKNGRTLDVFLYDKYVIRAPDQDLGELAAGMEAVQQEVAKYPDVVFGLTPQAFIYCGPEPTPAQVRAQIYLGIIHGARAFIYYSYNENYGATGFDESRTEFPGTATGMSLDPNRRKWWLPASVLWDAIGELNGEIVALQDLILADGNDRDIRCDDAKIDFLCRRVGGKRYWIAVNLTAQPRRAQFEFQAETDWTGCFGTPDCRTSAGANPVEFTGYEVKVWTTNEER